MARLGKARRGEVGRGEVGLGQARLGQARFGTAWPGQAWQGKDFNHNEATMGKHKFTLLLPLDIWQRLKALAERNRRPATQEIIIAILKHLDSESA